MPARPPSMHVIAAAPAQSSFTIFGFAPNLLFILPFPCALRAFSEGLSAPELGTQSRNEEAQRWIFDFAARIRSRILLETGTNFATNCPEIAPKFFGPFSLPLKIHAKSTPLSGPKSTPTLETFFSVLSLGGLRCCLWMPIFLCRPTETRKLS